MSICVPVAISAAGLPAHLLRRIEITLPESSVVRHDIGAVDERWEERHRPEIANANTFAAAASWIWRPDSDWGLAQTSECQYSTACRFQLKAASKPGRWETRRSIA